MSTTPERPNHHILVVEDEQHLAIGIKYNLEAEGFRVTTVSDGLAALQAVESSDLSVDLVILDIMLPGMSGYAVCERIRRAGNQLPILILSARTLTEDRIRGYEVGADQYLQKPFDLDELLSMVRNLLQRRGQATSRPDARAPQTFRFGDAEVNFDTFEVTVRGQPRRLTALQFKLLRYFVEHENIVVSRGELLENVWGMSHLPTTRTVDNFIVDLRKIFEQDPSAPRHFISVRGAGYRFLAAPEECRDSPGSGPGDRPEGPRRPRVDRGTRNSMSVPFAPPCLPPPSGRRAPKIRGFQGEIGY